VTARFEGYMTVREAAKHLGLSPSMVCRHIRSERLRGWLVAGRWFVLEEDVMEFEPRPVGNPNWRKKVEKS